jgi:RND superfamily putative drug exporter
MHLFGKANWWLPGWLDRLLPVLHVEPVGFAVGRGEGGSQDKVLELT